MLRSRGRIIDVTTLADFDRRVAAGVRDLGGWRVYGVDLTARGAALGGCRVAGAAFLDCRFLDGEDDVLRRQGALIMPGVDSCPLGEHRPELYTVDELYDSPRYADSFDARAYVWSQGPRGREDTLAAALHDHSMDEALATWVTDRRVVGVMGGHALTRGTTAYADAARLGKGLGRSHTVATGGGPGAMEAANLGARLAGNHQDVLDAALSQLATAPSFRPSIDAWLKPARTVVDATPDPVDSIGIPTWHYGHEPANIFATAIAKYVRNAVREAVLLEICNAGIVFLPGAGGTVQEIFQDACENFYADDTSLAPMVLVGREYWTERYPAWQLLQSLAKGRAMETHVHLVDTVEEAVTAVKEHRQ